VVCTASTSYSETHFAMHALEAGALSVLRKPKGLSDKDAAVDSAAIVDTLKLMSEVKLVRRWESPPPATLRSVQSLSEPAGRGDVHHPVSIVAIGASTGGPPAVLQILSGLTTAFPAPILLVQHISTGFAVGFAEWLASASGLPVRVAVDGETPLPGHVYVAPDDRHLSVGSRGELRTTCCEPQHGLRPSVGVLFRSVAEHIGSSSIGVLLTGMGRDGAEELKVMKDAGALTIAQDEESSVVFGMPGEAIKLDAARFVLPPQKIAKVLVERVRSSASKRGIYV